MSLSVAERQDIETVRGLLKSNLRTFSLQVHEPPHNMSPIHGIAVNQWDVATIANGANAFVVEFFIARGWCFRWESYGVKSTQNTPLYETEIVYGGRGISPWNPIDDDVLISGFEFATPKIRRHLPLWFKGPGTVRIRVANTGSGSADFAGNIVGWIFPETQVPESDIDFYRTEK